MHKRKKIALIGGGNIGGVLAQVAFQKNLGDVIIFDVVEGLPQGKALDMAEGCPIENSDCVIKGANSYADIKGADVVVVTAGIARKPGMSRDDLLKINTGIQKQVAEGIKEYAPNAFVVVVSNPLDAMVYVNHKITGFPKNRVVGMAGILDAARFRAFVAWELNVSVEDVHAVVMGGHGDTMVPIPRLSSVGGVPLAELLSKDQIAKIVKRTQDAGGEVVNLLKTGSAFVSPAMAAMEMVEAILLDRKRVVPCAAYLDGEYGIKGVFMGVPVVLGGNGVEKVLELKLEADEKALLDNSYKHVKSLVDAIPWN